MIEDLSRYCRCDSPLYWTGCYTQDARMKPYLDPATVTHPAKMAPGLLSRIFDHLRQLDLLPPGATVIDFMGGTGRTAIEATRRGYRAVTVELEPRFVEFQKLNKAATEKALKRKVDWEIRQGDARRLTEILAVGGAGIVSPPYNKEEHSRTRKQATMALQFKGRSYFEGAEYSPNPDNIGNLKAGIMSPPYGMGHEIGHNGGSECEERWMAKKRLHALYGDAPGNIGNMLAGVTSPPYMEAQTGGGIAQEGYTTPYQREKIGGGNKDPVGKRTYMAENHGATEGQIGNQKPETYWEAMRQVYTEAYQCGISPLVIVTKDPTRNRQIVPLGASTAALVESCGYHITDYHRAVLFEERRQATLDGEVKKAVAGRISFFKRLSIAKGSPAARWEDVLFAVKQL